VTDPAGDFTAAAVARRHRQVSQATGADLRALALGLPPEV
jgi:hypothetical protein